MTHFGSGPREDRVPLAGFRAWGPAAAGTASWVHLQEASQPPFVVPASTNSRQKLIATPQGVVLVMLHGEMSPDDRLGDDLLGNGASTRQILRALEAAHVEVQREMRATFPLATRRAA
jgi:hypothetical protein